MKGHRRDRGRVRASTSYQPVRFQKDEIRVWSETKEMLSLAGFGMLRVVGEGTRESLPGQEWNKQVGYYQLKCQREIDAAAW